MPFILLLVRPQFNSCIDFLACLPNYKSPTLQVLGKDAWNIRREVQLKDVLPEKAAAYILFPDERESRRAATIIYDKEEAHIIVTKKSKKVDLTTAGCQALAQQLGEVLDLSCMLVLAEGKATSQIVGTVSFTEFQGPRITFTMKE